MLWPLLLATPPASWGQEGIKLVVVIYMTIISLNKRISHRSWSGWGGSIFFHFFLPLSCIHWLLLSPELSPGVKVCQCSLNSVIDGAILLTYC